MKIFHWNCQGLRNPLTSFFLKSVHRKWRPNMMFLVETKNKDDYVESLGKEMGYANSLIISPEGLSGGLAIFWEAGLQVSVMGSPSLDITDMLVAANNITFCLSYIYGNPDKLLRNRQWRNIIAQEDDSKYKDLPRLFIGVMNDIRSNREKKGGPARADSTFQVFNGLINRLGLQEVNTTGGFFTWAGKRHRYSVKSRIDRALANVDWLDCFPDAEVKLLEWEASDHRPFLLLTEGNKWKGRKLFKYENRWRLDPQVHQQIQTVWEEKCLSLPPQEFVKALKTCRHALSEWKSRSANNSQRNIQQISLEIKRAYESDIIDFDLINNLKQNLLFEYRREEEYWKSKSRINWLQSGDKNTKFFHAKAKQRRYMNRISALKDSDGTIRYDQNDLRRIVHSHFTELFEEPEPWDTSLTQHMGHIPKRVTEDMNQSLLQPVTREEVYRALNSMDPDKAPGPDGLTAGFFKYHWRIIGQGVFNYIKLFFDTGVLDPELNRTLICLLPKVENPIQVSDFRPISLCNIAYKLISKVLALRMKPIMDKIISVNQSAFIPGRLITDNVLIAHELLHSLTARERKRKFMALKIDIAKAFDKVNWQFLEFMFSHLGFTEEFTRRIMTCVTSATLAVMVNGEFTEYIQPRRGIRQGDALSPYLYLVCAEGLSLLLSNLIRQKRLHGLKASRGGPSVSHLLFADDSLLFCEANEEECKSLLDALAVYGFLSGQKVNYNKSSIIFAKKTPQDIQNRLKQCTNISKTTGFGKYLGVPELINRKPTASFAYLKNRITSKLESWFSKLLSPAGKEVLIKAVIQALPTYAMSCFLLPNKLLDLISKAVRQFWWSSDAEKSKIHWIKWETFLKAKKSGGIGFRDFKLFNRALLAKQVWRLVKFPDSLLAKVFKAKYHPKSTIFEPASSKRTSYAWKGIIQMVDFIKKGLKWQVGDGKAIRVTEDNWLPFQVPRPARLSNNKIDANLKVSELMIPGTTVWDITKVQNFIHPQDVPHVLSIRPSIANSGDVLEWIHSSTGHYVVKNGYHLLNSEKPSTSVSPSIDFNKIWRANIPPKICHFWWKVAHKGLPTRIQFLHRKLPIDPVCQMCGEELESTKHLLFTCRVAKEIWDLSPVSCFNWEDNENKPIEEFLRKLLLDEINHQNKKYHPSLFIGWRIWKARNDLLFQSHRWPIPAIISKAMIEMEEWVDATAKVQLGERLYEDGSHFQNNRDNQLDDWTCNVDASWTSASERAGIGWTLINPQGKVVVQGSSSIDPINSPMEAEAYAIRDALIQVNRVGFSNVCFQGDNRTLYSLLSKLREEDNLSHQSLLGLSSYIGDIRSILSHSKGHLFRYVRRETNEKADRLAKEARKNLSAYRIAWES